jgi:hypothetical protein
MKHFFIFILWMSVCKAQQNLVPNWSFEQYTTCPSVGAITYVTPWFQPNLAGSSTDAFNACHNPIFPGVPNGISYQFPKTGNGFAGIQFFHDSTGSWPDMDREYLEVGLTSVLQNGKNYCVRFYAVKGNNSMWAIKQVQAALTVNAVTYNDANYGPILSVTPQIESSSIITDTLNWIAIQKVYTALGGESYITIGNFSPGAQTNRQLVLPYNSSPNTLGYYLIDDVSVYEIPEVNAGNDTTICPWSTTTIGPQNVRTDVQYSWSPSYGLSDTTVANPLASPMQNTTYILTVTDTNQWACYPQMYDTITVTVSGCSGIQNNSNKVSELKIIPNPSSGSFYFDKGINEKCLLEIFDVTGKKIFSENYSCIKEKELISVGNLSEGIYFLKISTVKNIFCTKLIIRN